MDLNNTAHTEVQSGLATCPSCRSAEWKSAKMVVMEGTTNTNGSLEGVVTDPGAFSGGVRQFLLSDRWFSWDNPIEAKIGLTSITGLVEEIKRLMVSHGSRVQMPTSPVEPRKIGFFEKITPVEPKQPPTEPPIPNAPVAPEDKPWYEHFFISIRRLFFFFAIALVLGSFLFDFYILFILASLSFGAGIPINFVASFWANRKQKKEYKAKLQMHPSLVNQAIERHRGECEQYEKDLKTYELQRRKADLQKNEEEQAICLYRKQLAEYEIGLANAMKERELLWERARVCTRCGTAYLSGVENYLKSAADSTQTTRLA